MKIYIVNTIIHHFHKSTNTNTNKYLLDIAMIVLALDNIVNNTTEIELASKTIQ